MTKRKEKNVCPKCGWKNPKEALFCLKCGSKVQKVEEAPTLLEGLVLLHITGSLYTIITVASDAYVRAFPFYILLYLSSGILGLAAAYVLHQKKGAKWVRALLSFAATALGLYGTFRLFYVGLRLSETISKLLEVDIVMPLAGPAWIIFAATGFKLWHDRNRL